MKKTLTITALILLTGCTTERVVYVEPTTTTEAVTSRPSIAVRETDYLNAVERGFGDLTGLTQEVLAAGWRTCDRADEGWTIQDFIEDTLGIADTRESQRLFAAVIAGALNYLCPEHEYLLDALDSAV